MAYDPAVQARLYRIELALLVLIEMELEGEKSADRLRMLEAISEKLRDVLGPEERWDPNS